jgi:hypothetical protein
MRSVSRDLFVQDIPADAQSVDDIVDDWLPKDLPFGRRAVIDAVLAIAPGADFTDPNWGRIDAPGVAIEVNLSDDEPLRSFAFHVRASDQAAADQLLRAILNRLGVRAFDTYSESGIFE